MFCCRPLPETVVDPLALSVLAPRLQQPLPRRHHRRHRPPQRRAFREEVPNLRAKLLEVVDGALEQVGQPAPRIVPLQHALVARCAPPRNPLLVDVAHRLDRTHQGLLGCSPEAQSTRSAGRRPFTGDHLVRFLILKSSRDFRDNLFFSVWHLLMSDMAPTDEVVSCGWIATRISAAYAGNIFLS